MCEREGVLIIGVASCDIETIVRNTSWLREGGWCVFQRGKRVYEGRGGVPPTLSRAPRRDSDQHTNSGRASNFE